MDEEFRDEVIPQGTQTVEVFYDVLKEIDSFEAVKRKSNGGQGNNFFVKQLKCRREELERERRNKQESWLDRQPFLKLDFNKPVEFEEMKSPVNNKKRLSMVIIKTS